MLITCPEGADIENGYALEDKPALVEGFVIYLHVTPNKNVVKMMMETSVLRKTENVSPPQTVAPLGYASRKNAVQVATVTYALMRTRNVHRPNEHLLLDAPIPVESPMG